MIYKLYKREKGKLMSTISLLVGLEQIKGALLRKASLTQFLFSK